MITYREAKMTDLETERRPPWESLPGSFLVQLIPSGIADPMPVQAAGMMDAIRIARYHYEPFRRLNPRLKVTRSDNTELFAGSL